MNAVLSNKIWISLGANIPGKWGHPQQSLARAIRELEQRGFALVAQSPVYTTIPLGSVRQPDFFNMVAELRGSVGPAALLRLLKRLERAAGRRSGVRWGPRPLDLDILDHGGRIMGGSGPRRRRGTLILPHPELHRRGFVLVPLEAVAPWWRHPRLGVRAKALLARQPALLRQVKPVAPSRR